MGFSWWTSQMVGLGTIGVWPPDFAIKQGREPWRTKCLDEDECAQLSHRDWPERWTTSLVGSCGVPMSNWVVYWRVWASLVISRRNPPWKRVVWVDDDILMVRRKRYRSSWRWEAAMEYWGETRRLCIQIKSNMCGIWGSGNWKVNEIRASYHRMFSAYLISSYYWPTWHMEQSSTLSYLFRITHGNSCMSLFFFLMNPLNDSRCVSVFS